MNRSFMWSPANGISSSPSPIPLNSPLTNLLGAPPFRPQASLSSGVNKICLSDQQKVLVTGGIAALQQHQQEAKDRQMVNRRSLTRTVSCGVTPQNNGRPSALNHHRSLQRSSSFDSNAVLNLSSVNTPPVQRPISTGSPTLVSPSSTPGVTANGYRSRETGLIEKLLVSYGFIKCADREGRLFFHYSQYHGEAPNLRINDEVEFEVSMDTRTGKPVAIQVIRLQKGTVMFEILSEDRVLGEVTSAAPPLSLVAGQTCVNAIPGGMAGVAGHGYKPSEKGEPVISGKLGSLSYERSGEFFFLPYSANDLTNPNLLLYSGDKVSFNIATEKRSGVMRARKITLVERAPPKRFLGIVTAMKESFGFIERADQVKEIFFHYSEVTANVPDLHVGDHVEFSIQERNNKDVATEIRLLPLGTVQLEEISNELYVGTIEKPLPAKTPNKAANESTIAGGDATSPSQSKCNQGQAIMNMNGTISSQPSLALAGVISYLTPVGDSRQIRFGEKDRAANCLHTLCKGDRVSFLTITDKRNGQQRAAGVTLLLDETLQISKEKRERGIVAAVKEGFGFIKCVERDSRLFFHCCELLDPAHHVRMSDEVEFTVLPDPVAEKQRMHATRIQLLAKGTVIFHTISDDLFIGSIELMPGATPIAAPKSPTDCLLSPALGPNPGMIVYTLAGGAAGNIDEHGDDDDGLQRLPFAAKDFREWMDALTAKIGDLVEFKICEVKRTGARSAVEIRLFSRKAEPSPPSGSVSPTALVRHRTLSHSMATSTGKLAPLFEESQDSQSTPKMILENVPTKRPASLSKTPNGRSPPMFAGAVSSAPPTLSSPAHSQPSPPREQEPAEDVVVSPTGPHVAASKVMAQQLAPLQLATFNDELPTQLCDVNQQPPCDTSANTLDAASDEQETGGCRTFASEQLFGWISTLKDTFGFIEDLEHNNEIFFHYSEMTSAVDKYYVAMPVTYHMGIKDDKPCAMQVEMSSESKFGTNTIISNKTFKGKVLKPLRSVNPSQSTYQGLIEYKESNATGETTIKTVAYSPLSLYDRRDYIQIGDKVTFQVSTEMSSGINRAINVKVNREIVRATVDSVKGEFGFINYEVSGGEGGNGKLFFHISEVRDPNQQISPGSTVEFSVVYNQRSGKFSASKVRLADAQPKQQRPERLRMRSVCDSTSGPVVTVIRQPRGPTEDVQGFAVHRKRTSSKTDAEGASGDQ